VVAGEVIAGKGAATAGAAMPSAIIAALARRVAIRDMEVVRIRIGELTV
jgi:hypothetical protein